MIQRIKGTQDFLDLNLFNFILHQAKKHLALYNFFEISTPILENLELFKRTLGQETDVVTKEMYLVNAGELSDESICLRPEGTASTMRAFVQAHIDQTPWKVYSWGPMFRHERPQKGRYREFHQITIENIGAASISHDAQFIKMLDRFFAEVLTLDTFALLINFLGCPQDRAKFKKVLDTYLNTILDSLCSTCVVRKEKNIMRVFDCKNQQCKELYLAAPVITQHLCPACEQEWTDLKNLLELLSVSYSHVPTLVRGLDYYEKTVFEFVSMQLGAQNAFCAGGRYNQLAREIGNREDQPSVGAAMGLERLILMLEPIKDRLPLVPKKPLHVILPLSAQQVPAALLLADELQAHNMATEVILDTASVKSMMRQADKLNALFCLILGEDEQKAHTVKLKNMTTGQENTVSQAALVQVLQQQE